MQFPGKGGTLALFLLDVQGLGPPGGLTKLEKKLLEVRDFFNLKNRKKAPKAFLMISGCFLELFWKLWEARQDRSRTILLLLLASISSLPPLGNYSGVIFGIIFNVFAICWFVCFVAFGFCSWWGLRGYF